MKRYFYVTFFRKGSIFQRVLCDCDGDFDFSYFEKHIAQHYNIKCCEVAIVFLKEISKRDYDCINGND